LSGAGYDLLAGEGLRIFEECQARAAQVSPLSLIAEAREPQAARYGEPQLVRPRLGQGTFRVAVTGAYGGACAVSREHSLPVLEAAHIRPYGSEGSHEIVNGLLLRADIHRLFDAGYVTVTPAISPSSSPRAGVAAPVLTQRPGTARPSRGPSLSARRALLRSR
jgi:putative restriction endonuclease